MQSGSARSCVFYFLVCNSNLLPSYHLLDLLLPPAGPPGISDGIESDYAPEEGALQVPAQTVYSFCGTNAAEAERIIVSPDHAAVGGDRGLVSDLSTRIYRAIYPMRLEGRARIGEVDDGSSQLLFESALGFGQLCSRVAWRYVSHVGMSHRVRPDRVTVACQPPHFVPRHHEALRRSRSFAPQLLPQQLDELILRGS